MTREAVPPLGQYLRSICNDQSEKERLLAFLEDHVAVAGDEPKDVHVVESVVQ